MIKTTAKPPTLKQLASALQVGVRRVTQLKQDGLPTNSVEAALAWRAAQIDTNSVEKLRAERILLVQEQRAKIALENQVRRNELIPAGQVQAAAHAVADVSRSRLMKLAADLPPRLEGLSATAMQKVIRDAVTEVCRYLSDPASYDLPCLDA
jgi:hypothetical protein